MRFFFDNNLALRIARAIDQLVDPPIKVHHLRERFPPNVADVDWMRTLAEDGDWVIVSGDLRITKNPHGRHAWEATGLTTFFLKGWMNQSFWLQAANLVRWFPDIMSQAQRVEPGASFIVPFKYSGRFKQPPLS